MPAASPNSFGKQYRLRTRADFDRIFARRCSAADERLIVYAVPNGLEHARAGFGVSKKVGSAVVRNRFKRIYREAFRLTRHQLPPGLDLVLVPRGKEGPRLEEVKSSLLKLTPLVARKLQREEKRG